MRNISYLYQIKFLNGKEKYSYDDNDIIKVPTNFFIIKKKKKFGIYSYDKKDLSFSDYGISDTSFNTVFYRSSKLELQKELPINYDSIWVMNNLIYFKKNTLTGIFPFNKSPRYLKLDTRNINFIPFTLPKNKKGWLDIRTGKEYLIK